MAGSQLACASSALASHAEGPIFLQANLLRHGIGGDHPRALHLWRNHDWTAFLGLSVSGVCFPQMRDARPEDWQLLRRTLRGRAIAGLNGQAAQVSRVIEAIDLRIDRARLDRTEPCYSLALDKLRIPDTTGLTLRAPDRKDLPLLQDWRAAYRAEIMGDAPDEARANALAELPQWLAEDSFRLAWQDDRPVAMTGFNARLPGQVQIGGVYTPPAARRKGLARRALALHLAEARDQGITHAFLFAASNPAARAYTAIGFSPAGHMRIVILDQPRKVAP